MLAIPCSASYFSSVDLKTGYNTIGTVEAKQQGTWNIGSITTMPSLTIGSIPTTTVTGEVKAVQSGTWDIGSVTTLPAITGTVTATMGAITLVPDQSINVGTVTTLPSVTLNALPSGTNSIGSAEVWDGTGPPLSIDSNGYGEGSIRGFPSAGITIKNPTGTAILARPSDGTNSAVIKISDGSTVEANNADTDTRYVIGTNRNVNGNNNYASRNYVNLNTYFYAGVG